MGTFRQATKKVSDVATYVKRQFGDESGVQVTDQDIIRWINAAQEEIVSTNSPIKGVATKVLEAGTYMYPLGGEIDIQYISSIQVSGVKIEPMSFQDAETYITNSDPAHTNVGMPQFWYEWAGVIHLYPTPDNAYTMGVYFTKPAPVVTVLTDTLGLPDNYFNRIVEFVMAQAYKMDENFQAHANEMNQFDSRLVGMANDENTPNIDVYPTITVLPEDY